MASAMNNNSMSESLTGAQVDWMMKTVFPRTVCWIWTRVSPSLKRVTLAGIRGLLRSLDTDSASGRLALPVNKSGFSTMRLLGLLRI